MEYHLYKVRFSRGANTRKEMFAELKTLLRRMGDLLDTSDKEAQLIANRASAAKSSAIDVSICSFFIRANNLFSAIKSAWNCCCQRQLYVHLLLQDRTKMSYDFKVTFAKSLSSAWDIRQMRIVQEDIIQIPEHAEIYNASNQVSQGTRVPAHRDMKPLKSALRQSSQSTTTNPRRWVPS